MLYDYQCNTCGEIFERQRAMGERDEATECPVCGSDDVRRIIISTPAIKFAWYVPALSQAEMPRMLRPVTRKVGEHGTSHFD